MATTDIYLNPPVLPWQTTPEPEHTTFSYFYPHHSLPCIALASRWNDTKRFPAWCLCPPLVYSGNAGACWAQSGQRRPHYCRTRRQAGGGEPHQPLWTLVFRRAVVLCYTNWIAACFSGDCFTVKGETNWGGVTRLRCCCLWSLFCSSLCIRGGRGHSCYLVPQVLLCVSISFYISALTCKMNSWIW